MRCKREVDSAYPSSTCGVKLRPCYHISMIQYYFSVCDRLFCAVGIMFFVCVCLCVSLFTSTLRILVQHLSWSCRWPWPQKDRSLFLSTRSGKPPPFPGVCGGLCSSNFFEPRTTSVDVRHLVFLAARFHPMNYDVAHVLPSLIRRFL